MNIILNLDRSVFNYLYNLYQGNKIIIGTMDFKKYIQAKIQYLGSHFKRNAVLLQDNGEKLFEINLTFEELSEDFMKKSQEIDSEEWQKEHSTIKMEQISQGFIKITDEELLPLWDHLTSCYSLAFNVADQNVGDLTLLKLAELYQQDKCKFTRLTFANNTKITQIGAIGLAASLKLPNNCECIQQIDMGNLVLGTNGANRIIELIVSSKNLKYVDLGLIGNSSLCYLAEILKNCHNVEHLGFGQDEKDEWKNGPKEFTEVIRRNENSKQILSLNIYPQRIVKYWDIIHELNILCQKRRSIKVNERENQFKAAALNPDHNKYYDPQNHGQNAYKFSVKSYLTNVFGSELDEALYFLEKERRNSIRQQSIFNITKQPINKIILQDICTADGSILVLAKYLLGKIRQKNS